MLVDDNYQLPERSYVSSKLIYNTLGRYKFSIRRPTRESDRDATAAKNPAASRIEIVAASTH